MTTLTQMHPRRTTTTSGTPIGPVRDAIGRSLRKIDWLTAQVHEGQAREAHLARQRTALTEALTTIAAGRAGDGLPLDAAAAASLASATLRRLRDDDLD